MGATDALTRVDEQRGDREGDEDPPLDPRSGRPGAADADVLLVEDAPDDEHARPRAGCGDDGAVAAGQVKGAALGTLKEQGHDAGGDEQHGRLDERECRPAGQ
jgi:hypothetical protein